MREHNVSPLRVLGLWLTHALVAVVSLFMIRGDLARGANPKGPAS